MDCPADLLRLLEQRIVFMDGAMGTMIQRHALTDDVYQAGAFADHPVALTGNHDLLNLLRPEIIGAIHRDYLAAGADLICTNSFNANAISQSDYGLADHVREMNLAAARIAREAADAVATPDHPRFVFGSLGPTNRTASLSPDVADPGKRNVNFAGLEACYREQASALLDGGVDGLLVETVFDTLNAKAAIHAVRQLRRERGPIPLMISATISDASGRTLSGQTIEAFCIAVEHAEALSIGLNCSLGAAALRPFIQALGDATTARVSCHPNAGLPNPLHPDGYNEGPDETAWALREMAQAGLVNLVGGCCGTTPDHIRAIVAAVADLPPHRPQTVLPSLRLSGLEPCVLPESGAPLLIIGERTNVAGSRRFMKLIQQEDYDQALVVALQQIDGGAAVIDVNLDDGMLDGPSCMDRFLNRCAVEPDIARVPVMVDSSDPATLLAGLRCLQGKGIVNSISLKEGDAAFLKAARRIRDHGAALVVMAFDEAGQAATCDRKVAICERAYGLLTADGFPATDIIFDANVLSIGTGIPEHDRYAVDFIRAVRLIKHRCPGARCSGGISNVSFAFRGNSPIREAMHAAFLYHAIQAGLDMAIVNAGMLAIYDAIDPVLRELVEDLIFARHPEATERLAAHAVSSIATSSGTAAIKADEQWRTLAVDQRLEHALVKGIDAYIDTDIDEAVPQFGGSALAIIEGPLMAGMGRVGDLFGQGKMFLPQVVKAARVMKRAVARLEPLLAADRTAGIEDRGTIVLATVKGDVHDIGKNIVGVVLSCNGYRVIDLGVMVSCQAILAAAAEHHADAIGLSGLITPSLTEMRHVGEEMERAGLQIPLLIGGATTSPKHTAVKLAPAYGGPVIQVADASRVTAVCSTFLDTTARPAAEEALRQRQHQLREAHARHQAAPLLPLTTARAKGFADTWADRDLPVPSLTGLVDLPDPDLAVLAGLIDWSPFFHVWGLKGVFPALLAQPDRGEQACRLYDAAQRHLDTIIHEARLVPRVVAGLWPAVAEGDDVVLRLADGERRLHFLRQQTEQHGVCLCLADFICPRSAGRQDHLGGFALTSGHEAKTLAAEAAAAGDAIDGIVVQALADRLAEATAEWTHREIRRLWGYGQAEDLDLAGLLAERYRGIRPAAGYPACPDHSEKAILWELLDAERRTGIRLTESYAMDPAASVSGLYFAHPGSRYFDVGRLGRDQVVDYAARKGVDLAAVNRLLETRLADDA